MHCFPNHIQLSFFLICDLYLLIIDKIILLLIKLIKALKKLSTFSLWYTYYMGIFSMIYLLKH